ncbi:MAG: stage 0 sporulation protein [Candidatus Acetothermia bacterium]|nr:stage 0 sporulation protein [Candidatus Acetothermia bacterium]MDH7505117.1 regulatory iron-sulfur-containing complex subunit RicT [Candidatus Acetothermia bacterium]
MKEQEQVVLVVLGRGRREQRYFRLGRLLLRPKELCIVEADLGEEFGEVLRGPELIRVSELDYPLQRVLRQATEEDQHRIAANRAEEERALVAAQEMVRRRGLPMKLVSCEYSFDRQRLTFHFTSPQRVDFRELLHELAAYFQARIVLHQIGPREETQLLGGLGRCGRTLCCATFLRNPESISMRMVYEQELFVPPERVTGLCGRLLCCLRYEHQNYVETLLKLPHIGSRIKHDGKKGKVVGHNIFKGTTIVELEDGRRVEVPGLSKEDVV